MLNTNTDDSDHFNIGKCHLIKCECTVYIVSEFAEQTLYFHCFKKKS